ncbi:MAG TPA: YfcE family phosphodiesterase [Spirochaetota bacterium]|nr:YfcE family phosphodiesterase [Spirochaetota bacterium]HOR44741.1 YfcE family phosphodiesterase [Spirochaetota bacterium]HOU84533.1 YfcE family phosphodiesterase [Spirochaetota bacterium]HPK56261.1 YfcE family phosphodiesterase [Spirochaetota bacterium]HQE58013.1 YfcE family phosphodiesterase [Spirochaetota bacterium]
MKVVIVSDSHGNKKTFERIIAESPPDILIFCGDGFSDIPSDFSGKLYAVRGNTDNVYADNEISLCISNINIFITHGEGYSVKSGLDHLRLRAKSMNADVVFFGHTHEQVHYIHGGIRLVNPGSLFNGYYAEWDNFPEGDLVLKRYHAE